MKPVTGAILFIAGYLLWAVGVTATVGVTALTGKGRAYAEAAAYGAAGVGALLALAGVVILIRSTAWARRPRRSHQAGPDEQEGPLAQPGARS